MTDNKHQLQSSTKRQLKWGNILFLLCWLVYFTVYIGRMNFSGAIPEIIKDTGWGKDLLGLVGTGFFFTYGVSQLFNGVLGDRISPVKMIFIGLVLSGGSNIAMTYTVNPSYMLLFWCLNGYALGMIWSPIIRLFSEWMPREQRMRAGVHISAAVPAGSLTSYGLTALLVALCGWRSAFMGAGIILFVIALSWLVMMPRVKNELFSRDVMEDRILQRERESMEVKAQGNSLGFFKVAAISGMIFVSISVMFNGIIKDSVTMWAPTYISEYFHLESVISVLTTTVLPIVNLGGVYAASYINRRLKNNETTTGALMFGIGFIALAMLAILGKYSVVLAVFFLAVATSAMLGANAMLIGIIPLYFSKIGKSSTVTGFLNSMTYLASAIATYGIGALVESFGWDSTLWWWVVIALIGGLICMLATKRWMKYKNDCCDEI